MRMHPWLLAVSALTALGCVATGSPREGQPATLAPTAPAPVLSHDAPTLLPEQPSFTTPEEAVESLQQASTAKDLKAMARILGLPEEDLTTGNPTADAEQASYFAAAREKYLKIVRDDDTSARVFVGEQNYPLASPLVKAGERWFFDSAGGKSELTARVISENELATIGVCRAYVQAQYEYYAEDRNGDDVLEYAQKLASSPGQHDGLYWHTEGADPESPLGSLIAEARATGYLKGSPRQLDTPKPYHGYLFQILTSQGETAAGGKHDYIINGHMIAGFALIAYPATWNRTGVMTFLVAANGKVFEKNLGERTADVAGAMTEYNPDASWSVVSE